MKELSIEEKAQRYDEAVKKLKVLHDDWATTQNRAAKEVEEIFPELVESEDELTWLKRFIKEEIDCLSFDIRDSEDRVKLKNLQRSIAWLEKQGEQKAVIVPKFRIGDTVRAKTMKDFVFTIKDITDKQYVDTNDGKYDIEGQDYLELVEQKPWSEEDEAIYYGVIETEQYMLDVVNGIKKFNVGNISIKEECTRELNWLKSLKERVLPQPKQEWSEDLEKEIAFFAINAGTGDNTPTIGEIAHHFVEWQKKHESEWSEEDEKMLRYAVDFISTSPHPYAGDTLRGEKGKDEIINWLKSLRPSHSGNRVTSR